MSDHIDGPRQIGDPAADLTDLFAFTSPENPARTVLAANVFPSAGADAMFSNAINHSIVVRRVTVAGLGDAAKFQTGRPGNSLQLPVRCPRTRHCRGRSPSSAAPALFLTVRRFAFVVNDEKGSVHAGRCLPRIRGPAFRSVSSLPGLFQA